MSSEIEHIEYDRDINPYPSSGKKYNSEKAIISMTSWKMRIATCPKTIFSLLKQCPGFHIVLVLSEEEFPQKEKELPENLMVFVENELIELLWVYKNYKSFKKVLFTMDKYRDVPVISADDDCIYTNNYAKELYDAWLKNKTRRISYNVSIYFDTYYVCCGPCTLYPPNFCSISKIDFSKLLKIKSYDDWFFAVVKQLKPYSLNRKLPFVFHDCILGLSAKKYSLKERKIYFDYYRKCFI